MTQFFADAGGNYLGAFDGDGALATVPPGAIEVPGPPDHGALQTWNGARWVDVPARADREAEAAFKPRFENDRVARLMFEINLDQENRLRGLEGGPAVTRAAYRAALLARLKAL